MLLKNPHLLVASGFEPVLAEGLKGAADGDRGRVARGAEGVDLRRFGTSKICKFPLSDVHASILPEGLKRKENIVAFSVPRLRSANFAQLPVANMRTSVP
jgi:hypothetical protein